MKVKTGLKIAFCVLLAAALAIGVLQPRWGRNTLEATCTQIRNGRFTVSVHSDVEEYYPQRMCVSLVNKNDFDVTVLGLRVEKGDESRFRLYRTPEQTVTIPAHTTEPQNVWFRIVSYGPENEQVLEKLRRDFSVRIVYADAAAGITALSEADESVLRTEWVHFN